MKLWCEPIRSIRLRKDNSWALLFYFVLPFWIITIYLAQKGLYQYIIVATLIMTVIAYFIRNINVVTIYIYFLALSHIVATDYNLGGIIGIDEVTQIFIIIFLIKYKKLVREPTTQWQKLCTSIIALIMFIEIYQIVKDIAFGLSSDNVIYIFKSIIKRTAKYIPLILVINNLQSHKIRNYVFTGMVLSIITIVLSTFFIDQLTAIKILSLGITNESEMGFYRLAGVYGAGGDANSAAAFLTVAIGFFLALFEKQIKVKMSLTIIGLGALGLFLTASRTSMISLGVILVLFLIRNKTSKKAATIIAAGVVFFAVFNPLIIQSASRFQAKSFDSAINPDKTGRIGKWKIYTKWLTDNPETLLLGNQKKIMYDRAPHNYYIYLTYHVGVFFLICFVYCVIKICHFSLKKRGGLFMFYAIFPYLFVLMTINVTGAGIYLWVFLPMSTFISRENQPKKVT